MFRMKDYQCINEACTLEFYEAFIDEEEEAAGVPCPECGVPMTKTKMPQAPCYGKHGSWAMWRLSADWETD